MSVFSTSTFLEDHCLLFEGLGDLLIASTLSNSCDQKELGNRKMLGYFFFTCDPWQTTNCVLLNQIHLNLPFKSGIRKWWGLNWVPHSLYYHPCPARFFVLELFMKHLKMQECWYLLLKQATFFEFFAPQHLMGIQPVSLAASLQKPPSSSFSPKRRKQNHFRD